MHIGIDARMYGHHTRGIGRYIQEIISEIEKIDHVNQYTIFLCKKNFDDFTPKNKNFTKVLAPWRWYSLSEQLYFPQLIKKHQIDLMHFPHFNVPLFFNAPYIVTIHDLILLRSSQKRATTLGPIKYYIKKFFYRIIIKHAIKKAQHIIALTKFGKQDIQKDFSIPPKKISVIYQGISVQKPNNTKMDTHLQLRYNINKPYVLYVGSAYPHKNLQTLIAAMDIVHQTHDMQLVFVGKKDFFYQRQQQEYPRDYIIYTDYISDTDLAQIYQHAHCYAFPSLYEGFGMPPLEAMQYSCPVISSNSSCLPEILKDAALYIDPHNPQQLAQYILQLYNDSSLRTSLIKKGLDLCHEYNWETTGKQTHKKYLNVE